MEPSKAWPVRFFLFLLSQSEPVRAQCRDWLKWILGVQGPIRDGHTEIAKLQKAMNVRTRTRNIVIPTWRINPFSLIFVGFLWLCYVSVSFPWSHGESGPCGPYCAQFRDRVSYNMGGDTASVTVNGERLKPMPQHPPPSASQRCKVTTGHPQPRKTKTKQKQFENPAYGAKPTKREQRREFLLNPEELPPRGVYTDVRPPMT